MGLMLQYFKTKYLNKQRYVSDNSCIDLDLESSNSMESGTFIWGCKTLTDSYILKTSKEKRPTKQYLPPTGLAIYMKDLPNTKLINLKGTQGFKGKQDQFGKLQRVNHSNFAETLRVPQQLLSRSTDEERKYVGFPAVLPQTVKSGQLINPKQTWRTKRENHLDSVNWVMDLTHSSNLGNPEEELKFKGGYSWPLEMTLKVEESSGIRKPLRHHGLDLRKVSYVEELKFNLLSVSQICDKKQQCSIPDKELESVNRKKYCVVAVDMDSVQEFKLMEYEFCARKNQTENIALQGLHRKEMVLRKKDRTLIEAARTMLADSLLPIQFWAEAVNTACYVLNRVLVTKPQMKTPYEILMGRSPNISFMRPFGCPYDIYFISSSYEENQKGKGPDWMFDLDLLTPSMNYIPVRKENYADSTEQGISMVFSIQNFLDAVEGGVETTTNWFYHDFWDIVMVAPSIPVFVDSAQGSFGDMIDIDVDVIHPKPVAAVAFPAALAQHGEAIRGIHEHLVGVPIQEELTALRNRVDIVEEENASLRARIRTTEAINRITRNHERRVGIESERQLASVQESH
ncbi:ribonuclease H-like domain-containing protein [Tanacetum coccineum]